MSNVKIINEVITKPLNTVLDFSGGSTGGTDRMKVVLKHFIKTNSRFISVGVTPGSKQSLVAESIKRQYELINSVTKLPFDLEIICLARYF